MKRFVALAALCVLIMMMTGCGGALYVRPELQDVAAKTSRYGVMLADYQVKLVNRDVYLEGANLKTVNSLVSKDLVNIMKAGGRDAVAVKDTESAENLEQAFIRIPKNWRKVPQIDDNTNLGDLTPLFTENSIDTLFVISGLSTILPNDPSLGRAGIEIGIGLALGAVVSSAPTPPATIAFVTAVTKDGKIVYRERTQFTGVRMIGKSGNILDEKARGVILQTLYDQYVTESK